MTLTAAQANRIYDILVREAGADNRSYSRECFVLSVTLPEFREYRFCGALGFGGKFRISSDRWFVTCYIEDFNDDRQETMMRIDEILVLERLKAIHQARAEVLS